MDDFDEEAPTAERDWDLQSPLDLPPVEMQFVLGIRDTPDDFALRMVYADWLEQDGQLGRSELVRLLSDPPPERERLRDLGWLEPNDWIAIVSRAPIDGCEQALQRTCTQRWESLASTDEPRVRRCAECDREVYFCASLEMVGRHAEPSHRVAYSPLLPHGAAVDVYDGGELVDGGRRLRERRARRLTRSPDSSGG